MARKILIVDDNPMNRELLSRIFSNDYYALTASNGEDALKMLNTYSGDISAVVLDLVMPVMDGFEVLTVKKQNKALSRVPVMVLTGENTDDAEIKALRLGADDFAVKPYNPEVLRHRLKNLIALKESAAAQEDIGLSELMQLSENIPGGFAVYEKTQSDLRNLFFNDEFIEYSGYSRKDYDELYKVCKFGTVFEDDYDIVEKAVDEICKTGSTKNCVYRCRTKDGGYRWFSLTGKILEKSFSSIYFSIMQYDITDTKLAEEALRISRDELMRLSESSN